MSTSADDGRVAVRLRSQVLGSPGGEAGEVVRLLPSIARAWLAAGLAEDVADDLETAAVAAPEAAMVRRGRPRSRG